MQKILIISFIVTTLALTEGRSTINRPRFKREHIPPPGVPTFRRDSVEHIPKGEKNLPLLTETHYGSTTIPLRAAVESVPNVLENSRRLPLRDAVEKRPPPDDPLDIEQDIISGQLNLNDDSIETYAANLNFQQQYYPFLQTPYQGYQQSYYSPIQYFQNILTDYKVTNPYRIDNSYQQLIVSPFGLPQYDLHQRFKKSSADNQKIVCYVGGIAAYRKEPLTFGPEDLDPYICTHIIYNYATIDPITYTIVSNDENYDIVKGGYKAITSLRNKNPNLKILISLGGSKEDGSRRFSNMVSNSRKRINFIRSLISFLEKYNFDGMEVHWEYPGSQEFGGQRTDKEFLALFLEETSEIFKQRQWSLVLSAPASRFKVEDGFNPERIGNFVDFVNLQTYDFHFERESVADHHANLFTRPEDSGLNIFFNVDYAVQFWLRKGLPNSKLILGIPFFGRSFTLKHANQTEIGSPIIGAGREGYYTRTPGFLAYFEICDMILNEGWFKSEDAAGSPFIVNGDQWVGYDDTVSIKRKIDYVKEHKLGGVVINAADFDDFKGLCGAKWPLLTTINSELKGVNPVFISDAMEVPPTKPFGVCDSVGYYSDSSNCAAYYICKNGLIYHLSCGNDLMFNPTNGKCDHVNPLNCRPGETIYIPSSLKEIRLTDEKEKFIDKKSKVSKRNVVCYVTNWAFYRKGEGKFVPEHIDQRLCTHVVYAFASLDPEKLLIKEFDPWADLDNNLYERITSLKDTKVLLSLGGWTDSTGDKYSRLVSDGSARRKFVIGVVAFLRKYKFRGLQFDWNYPTCWQSNCQRGPSTDKANFAKIIQELRKEFDKQSPPLILAAAISGYKEVIDLAYDLPTLGENLDFLSVMTYDYHGAWEGQTGHVSPLYGRPGDTYPQYNVNFTMEYLVSKGAPKEKLLLAIPFYGQSFTLTKKSNYSEGTRSNGPGEPGEYTKQPGMLAYYEICNKIKNQRWIANKNNIETGPYAYSTDQWVGYEDTTSIKRKVELIKSRGFGGAVAWTIDLDDFNNRCCEGSFPLLKTLSRGLGLISDEPVRTDCTKPVPPSTPAPPETTTGVDSGIFTTTSWWSTITTTKPSSTTAWWERPSSTWWSTEKTTTRSPVTWWTTTTSTTKRPTTTQRPIYHPPSGSVIPPPTVVSPELDRPVKKCETQEYIPDPKNCNAFYRCVGNELQKQYCAGGLHWNKEQQLCDWPDRAKCVEHNNVFKPTTKKPLKPTTSNWQSIGTTTRRTTSLPLTTIADTCNSGSYYPHELCNHFYVCFNKQLVEQVCPPGLNFDAEKGMCDWSFKVKCTNRKKVAQIFTTIHDRYYSGRPQPHSKCEGNSFAPLIGSCTQFMHCQWNKYEIMQCAPGLHWNNEKKICDWPLNAHCTEESNTNELDEDFDTDTSTPPSWGKPTTSGSYPEWSPASTTKYPEWTPPSTTQWTPASTESTGNEWEWHPPIPPTSEKPPLPETLKPLSGYYKIVCYFTNWAWYRRGIGKYLPEDIDENLCTHIVYGFAVLDYSNYVIKAHDSWADFDNQFYKRVVGYKSKGVKVSLAIGGWNDSLGDKYSKLVNNPAARRRFIEHVMKFLEKYNFDGLDLDWEYPKCWQVDCKKGPDSDKAAFADFVKELKQAFKPKGYLLSAAVSPSKTVIDAGYDVPALAEHLDWVAVMTYDFHGQWDKQTGHVAPLYYHPKDEVAFFNANFSINYWISEGLPRRKLIMGMPLYGQSFRLEKESENGLNAKAPGPGEAGEYTRAAGFLAYYEICDKIKNKGWNVVQDPTGAMGPYAFKGNQWVSFDDAAMIRKKSEYIRKMDLGGGMIWALDLDDFKNSCGQGRHPLLTIIRNTLADAGSGHPEPFSVEEMPSPSIEAVVEEVSETSSQLQSLIDSNSEYKVVCYFTNWAWYRQGVGKYLPQDIDPDLCTHIVYGFAVLNGDQLIIKPHDSWADFDNKFYEKVTALKEKGIKVLIAIGGWNDSAGDKYSKLVNNPSARRRFIAHVLDFIEKHNFDGLDLDWEYPKCWQVDCKKGPVTDKAAFAAFVRELHEAFRPKGWLLSSAVSPSKKIIDAGYDVPILSKYLDWIAVMCYDYHGQWDKVTGHVAPMYEHPESSDDTFNTNFTINYWIEKGADRKKLVMGMPMYGQSFSLSDNSNHGLNAPSYGGGEAGDETRARGFLAYYEICSNIKRKNWTLVRDNKGRIGPYAYHRDQWVSFDDIGMIRHKSEYVKAMGLGGGMIWALDLDDFKNICNCEEYPLLKTINRVLRGYKIPDPKCILDTRTVNTPTIVLPPQKPSVIPDLPCSGRLFLSHETNCNQYYLCNQGHLQLQSCPDSLYWNVDHCDWPENSQCHPDGSTATPVDDIADNTIQIPEDNSIEKPGNEVNQGHKVICYFTNWAWYRQGDGKYLPSDINPELCTHINYGFAVLDPDSLSIKPHDSWTDIDNGFYKKVTEYKSKGVKVLIAIGGWNDSLGDKYSRMVNNPEARAKFVTSVIDFIEKYDFDGLDLDWEYPKCWQVDCNKGPDTDKQAFASLVTELSSAFKPKGLLLSSAVSPSKAVIDAGYDVPTLSKYLDWISIMTYDFHGHWDKRTGHVAPLYYHPGTTYDYFNSNYTINYWISNGAPPEKLIMGIPLYGQSFTLADSSNNGLYEKTYGPGETGEFTGAGGFLSFYEICEKVRKYGWNVTRDPKGRIGPYATHGTQWVSYDDISEVKRKAKLIKQLGLGGGMVWALDLDDFRNRCGCGHHPLLKALNKELRGRKSDITMSNCT
ncbi:probable chitinase 10 [Diorhabda sublineata]|uniref:probable chitinase 10 n=1 Tax=Diorhabda sublineata TaxID=1163346 RepID=UPI0024E0CDE7|nr:probable chitinase 10 [Diorhabda sublineata]